MDVLERAQARVRFPALNVVLFAATVVTTLWSGFTMVGAPGGVGAGMSPAEVARGLAAAAWAGLPFAGSLVAILLTHEMGHYVLARRHRVATTLPFFIPFLPWSLGGIRDARGGDPPALPHAHARGPPWRSGQPAPSPASPSPFPCSSGGSPIHQWCMRPPSAGAGSSRRWGSCSNGSG